eukprot:5414024-Amphidinium_carterae.1
MEEAAPENRDSDSMRACEGSESDVTQDVVGNADASGTSVKSASNKMTATHDEEPVGKRAKTGRTESEAESVVQEQPASVPGDVPLVPVQPVQGQPEPSPSPVQHRRAETVGPSTRYRESTTFARQRA